MENNQLTRQERRRQQREFGRQTNGLSATGSWTFPVWGIWVVLVLILIGSIVGAVILAKRNPNLATGPRQLALAVSATDWTKGSATNLVSLVEYSDFQCSACAFYYPWVKRLGEDFADSLAITYRHFPLRSIHPNAQLAAEVSEAAGRQAKFWEMHDLLFEKQTEWDKSTKPLELFTSYAQSLNLDLVKFADNLEDREIKNKIEADYQSGVRSGVNGTPTFFINGEKINNPRSYEDFAALIAQALVAPTTP